MHSVPPICRSLACLALTSSPLWAQLAGPYSIAETPLVNQGGPIVIQASQGKTTTSEEVDPDAPRVITGNPGPWGRLEYYHVYLEAPSYLVDQFPMPSSKSRWIFTPAQESSLPSLLAETGLTAEQVEAVLNAPGKLSNADGVYLFPPPQLILDITPEVRSKLYATLRKIPANEYHVDPVLILNDDAEKWFTNSGLRPEIIDMIDKLSYKRGDLTAFSDLSLLMNLASGESEGRQILKAMTRTRSLILRMIITNHSEVDENMKYWTTGLNLRRKDVVPMLHSVIETQGVEKLDILHLLPALPRKLLYTYPDPSMGAEGIFPDCHWTTLNFFNYNAESYLLDSRLATTKVLESFVQVDPPYRFGDVLFFLDTEHGDAFHSCIYIADDIVYSKNGRNLLSPWILTKLDDIKHVYLFDGNGRVQGFRHKKSTSAPAGE
jgi:hypothetical protein